MTASEPSPPLRPATDRRPAIVAVDDDAAVLGAVVRDLRAEFGDAFRIHAAASGDEALQTLRSLRLRGGCVAMVVADQRMPGLTGIELLRESLPLYPEAKRVLLTAYADNDVAIRAINEVRLDHYFMKPWDPPEDEFYPVLRDLLDDWQAAQHRPGRGLRVIGHAWSGEGHELRDFLTRNLIPFGWLDIEVDPEARALLDAAGAPSAALPFVVYPDGSYAERPSRRSVAERLGLSTRPAAPVYDLVIVGAGPAGLAGALYAASEGLTTLLVEREAPGGQAGRSKRIENYLGFPSGLSGGDLARRAVAQARRFGAEILTPAEVTQLRSSDGYHTLVLSDGGEVSARAVLIAAGISYRLLELPGAERLTGSGVFYGASISEALAVRGLDVLILGGGNSAGQAALHLAGFARSVTLVVRRPSLRTTMSDYLIRQIEATANIGVSIETELVEVHGEHRLEAVTTRDLRSGRAERRETPALFVFIGATPHTDWIGDAPARDAQGFVLAGPAAAGRGGAHGWPLKREPLTLETSVPGVFVAGDVRHRSIKGVAAAVGEGTTALRQVVQYLGGSALLRPPHAAAPPPADGEPRMADADPPPPAAGAPPAEPAVA